MPDLLALGLPGREALGRAASSGAVRYPLEHLDLLAPIPRPPAVLGIARNYTDHIAEMGSERPSRQTWFAKVPTCVVGPGAAIEIPAVSDQVDYEGELGVVIGRRCRHVPVDRALDVVAGYTVVNDVSVRDWQRSTPTMTLGKSFGVRTWVNGELRQDGHTSDMVFTCAQMIAHLTEVMTLEPGTILATGTPAGVGTASDPPRWLVAGDVVTVAVDGVGKLTNSVVAATGGGAGDAW